MMNVSRRDFLKLGAAAAAIITVDKGRTLINAMELERIKDYNPQTGKERKKIPSSCWQCVTRDSMIGYVEDGRIVKLDGNPESIRSPYLCAKGQAGINHVYDPDRLLYPMKREGKRGEGKWKRISWDEALGMIIDGYERDGKHIKGLKEIRADNPGKFMFHYGRMKASSSKIVKSIFLESYGTKTVGNHTSICEGGKWTAQELTWGAHYDNWDFDNTNFVLNFGSNCLETHTNHTPVAHRLVKAMAERGARMVTFDVRLSNTAARSNEWIPIKPGTDGAVVLAMCNVIMQEGLYKGEGEEFLKFCKVTKDPAASTEEKVLALISHLGQYSPEWAEKESGVPAEKIRSLAIEFAKAKPACVISYRGAVTHYNGNETERAIQMLASITGNIDNPGGRCKAVGAKWVHLHGPKDKPSAKKLDILDGEGAAFPTHHMSHHVLKMIKDGSNGRPDLYMWYCYTPVYANGEVQENIDILKDEGLIPFTVCSNTVYDESGALADLIIPDATYLERWDWEDMVSPSQIPEYYIRQPLVKPLGEATDFKDVCIEIAKRMGFPLGFDSTEEFVRYSCENTPGVKEAGGFDYMKEHGVWHDPDAKPKYYSYKKLVKDIHDEPVFIGEGRYADMEHAGEVAPHIGSDVVFDEETGVYWHWTKSKAKSEEDAKEKGYTHTKDAYKGYVGQLIDDSIYIGFKPDKLNKSGFLELYSLLLEDKGFNPLPTYIPIPEHQVMKSGELILTTYKLNVHIHSRSANCKWLTEIAHDNPGHINPKTASEVGIKTGDRIKVKSRIGEITTKAFVTDGIVPGVIAISHHMGHWEYGRYATGKKAPLSGGDDPDLKLKWWTEHGVHPNWIIPNSPDPINGQQRWNDTVVTVSKA